MNEPIQKASLADFIKDNSTLITSLAAFVALTAFSLQLEKEHAHLGLPAAALLGAVLISIELFWRVPHGPREWRLVLFEIVLLCLPVAMGQCWFSNYPELWMPALIGLIQTVLFVVVAALATYAVRSAAKELAPLFFKGPIGGERLQKASSVAFLFFLFLTLGGWVWVLHKLQGRQIQIKLPHF